MSTKKKFLQAAAGAAGGGAVYVDDVFSTDLWKTASNNDNATVTNGLDLSGEGGLIWLKNRDTSGNHTLFDSTRGLQYGIYADGYDAQWDTTSFGFTAPTFNADGYSTGTASVYTTAGTHVGWSFRKQEKFFDVVKYTGTGSARDIAHNLGSVPGMVIIKSLDRTYKWIVSHRSFANLSEYISLNETSAKSTDANVFGSSSDSHTATTFHVGTDSYGNQNGDEYIAYLFAHDEQEFGTDSDEAIIKCGTYTGNSTNQTIDVGFETQWVLIKNITSGSTDWFVVDTMRGMVDTGAVDAYLIRANESDAEQTSGAGGARITTRSTGFGFINESNLSCNRSGETYIYVAIRRPHKPASEFAATDLYATASQRPKVSGSLGGFRAGFVADFALKFEQVGNHNRDISCRLAAGRGMYTDLNNAEAGLSVATYDFQDGMGDQSLTDTNNLRMLLRRAPGFFDVVCYEGNQTARQIAHNLGAVPEMMWVKCRSQTRNWAVYAAPQGNTKVAQLNGADAFTADTSSWNNTSPTSTHFTVGDSATTNFNPEPMIAFLFATVPGISKVGSYTATGSNINVDCGFTNGARFVLIKWANDVSSWYLWDSVRGIVAGNDPYLQLNSSNAQVTTTDWIDPLSSGFTVTSAAGNDVNNSGGTYIFYAIA